MRRGLYVAVPLDARRSGEWVEDPWVVAERLFSPCYIGGWSACEHWELTEQTVPYPAGRHGPPGSPPRHRDAGHPAPPDRPRPHAMFGDRFVWRAQNRWRVGPVPYHRRRARRPAPRGRHPNRAPTCSTSTSRSEHRDDQLLIDYGDRLGNRTVFKRLGYLIEHLGADAPELIQACLERRSSGLATLDPSVKSRAASCDAGACGSTSHSDRPEASGDHAGRHRRARRRVAANRGGHREGLRAGLAAVGHRRRSRPRRHWVFKGGTCLKKCYIETYRFSEDLDFTVLPGGPYRPEQIEPLLGRVLARVHEARASTSPRQPPSLRLRPDGLSTEGRVYYVGPRQTPQPARVKLDISANETVVRPPVLRDIAHPYPDGPLPGQGPLLLL